MCPAQPPSRGSSAVCPAARGEAPHAARLTARSRLSEEEDMLPIRWVSAGVLALLGLACSDRDVTVRAGGAGDLTGPLALVTFNAAIGVGLAPYAEQRLEVIERSLPELGADVICLQELWQPDDLDRLASNLVGDFPFSHRSVSGAAMLEGCTQS